MFFAYFGEFIVTYIFRLVNRLNYKFCKNVSTFFLKQERYGSMIAKCFVGITLFSIIFAVFSGNTPMLTGAVVDGCTRAVQLSIELCGMSCLWCGLLQVFTDSGILDFVSRILSPILRRIFPAAWKSGTGKREITAAVSANILGIGNAATPYALAAMQKLDSLNPNPTVTTSDMAAFTVLGTASLNLLPTTLITLRRAAGSAEPYAILIPIWLSSIVCAGIGVILVRLCAAVWERHD